MDRTRVDPVTDAGRGIGVRSAWLEAFVARCQILAGDVLGVDDPRAIHRLIAQLIRNVDPPTTRVEEVVLEGLLLDVAARCGRSLHWFVHLGHESDCAFRPVNLLTHYWSGLDRGPTGALELWADAFCGAFERAHPACGARRAASAMQMRYSESWDIRRFCIAADMGWRQLRRVFVVEYGVSPRIYLRTIRVLHAMEAIAAGGKIESIARDVGFKSKKNFIHAFRVVTSVSPGQFRQLSATGRRPIIQRTQSSVSMA